MAVHQWQAPIKMRVFRVTYCPDLDDPEGNAIGLGVFGDLRMGERFALGLIARTRTLESEIQRVGRLSRHLVAKPYDTLRALYEEIWNSKDPAQSFEGVLRRGHHAVLFSTPKIIEGSMTHEDGAVVGDGIDAVRQRCMDMLRAELRTLFHEWMAETGSPDLPEREQVDAMREAA